MEEVIINKEMLKILNAAIESDPYKHKVWTNEEDEILKKYYGKISTIKLSSILNKSVDQIYHRSSRLGLNIKSNIK